MRVLVLFSHGHKPGLLRMLNALEARLVPRGFDFFHIISPKESEVFSNYGFNSRDVIIMKGLKKSSNPISSILTTNKIKKICVEKRVDFILSYTLSTLPKAITVSKKTDIPCAVWLHNAYPDSNVRYKRFDLDRCRNIITVSDFIMSDVRSYLTSIGIRPGDKNLNVVYNALDTDRFIRQADEQGTADAVLPEKKGLVVGMFAAMDRNKNPQLLLRSAIKVLSVDSNVNFWFIGGFPEKEYEEETIALVKELGISDKVFFLGPRTDVSRIYREIDIFVHPSFRDACPLAPMEAMTWGKAVVASRTGGVPEIVEDGVTGILCEPGNIGDFAEAIQKLVIDNELREKIGYKGKERVYKMFSMERLAADVEQVFNKIVKSR